MLCTRTMDVPKNADGSESPGAIHRRKNRYISPYHQERTVESMNKPQTRIKVRCPSSAVSTDQVCETLKVSHPRASKIHLSDIPSKNDKKTKPFSEFNTRTVSGNPARNGSPSNGQQDVNDDDLDLLFYGYDSIPESKYKVGRKFRHLEHSVSEEGDQPKNKKIPIRRENSTQGFCSKEIRPEVSNHSPKDGHQPRRDYVSINKVGLCRNGTKPQTKEETQQKKLTMNGPKHRPLKKQQVLSKAQKSSSMNNLCDPEIRTLSQSKNSHVGNLVKHFGSSIDLTTNGKCKKPSNLHKTQERDTTLVKSVSIPFNLHKKSKCGVNTGSTSDLVGSSRRDLEKKSRSPPSPENAQHEKMSSKGLPTILRSRECKPSFIVKPRRQFADEGGVAKFRTSFDGQPEPEIVWQKQGETLTDVAKYKFYEKNRFHFLEILDVTDEDGGSYSCTVTNRLGSESINTELEVFSKKKLSSVTPGRARCEAPRFERHLEDVTVTEGEILRLQCVVKAHPKPFIQWHHNKKILRKTSGVDQQFDGKIATLSIINTDSKYAGQFDCCIVSNAVGDVKSSCKVTVKASKPLKPVVTKHLMDMDITDGETAIFECHFEVDNEKQAVTDILWYKGQSQIRRAQDINMDFDGKIARLKMADVIPEDSGTYKCVAENVAGRVESSCLLVVEEVKPAKVTAVNKVSSVQNSGLPPSFIQPLEDRKVIAGEEVELTAVVQGDTPMKVCWLHNDKDIEASDKAFDMVSEGNKHKLVIGEASASTSGLYICEVYNQHGDDDTSCQLTVSEPQQRTSHHRLNGSVKTSILNVPAESKQSADKALDEHSRSVSTKSSPKSMRSPDLVQNYSTKGQHKLSEDRPANQPLVPSVHSTPEPQRFSSSVTFGIVGGTLSSNSPTVDIPTSGKSESFLKFENEELIIKLPNSDELQHSKQPIKMQGSSSNKSSSLTEARKKFESPGKVTSVETKIPDSKSRQPIKIKDFEKPGSLSEARKRFEAGGTPVSASPRREVKRIGTPSKYSPSVNSTNDSGSSKKTVKIPDSKTSVLEARRKFETSKGDSVSNSTQIDTSRRTSSEFDIKTKSSKHSIKQYSEEDDSILKIENQTGVSETEETEILPNDNDNGTLKIQISSNLLDNTKELDAEEVLAVPEDTQDEMVSSAAADLEGRSDQPQVINSQSSEYSTDSLQLTEQSPSSDELIEDKSQSVEHISTDSQQTLEHISNDAQETVEHTLTDSQETVSEHISTESQETVEHISNESEETVEQISNESEETVEHISNDAQQTLEHLSTESHETVEHISDDSQEIVSPARFVRKPESANVDEGSTVSFMCRVEGNPKPQVTWLTRGKAIQDGDRFKCSEDGDEFSLELHHALSSDTGRYTCTVSNSEGRDRSLVSLVVRQIDSPAEVTDFRSVLKTRPQLKKFDVSTDIDKPPVVAPPGGKQHDFRGVLKRHVTTQEKPKIVSPLVDKEFREGQKVILEVKVTGYPQPKVTWFHGHKEIKESKFFKMSYSSSDQVASLVISEAFMEDGGQYYCRAESEIGSAQSTCRLYVRDLELEKERNSNPGAIAFSKYHFESVATADRSNSTSHDLNQPHDLDPCDQKESHDSTNDTFQEETLHTDDSLNDSVDIEQYENDNLGTLLDNSGLQADKDESRATNVNQNAEETQHPHAEQVSDNESPAGLLSDHEAELSLDYSNSENSSKLSMTHDEPPMIVNLVPQSLNILKGCAIELRGTFVGRPAPAVKWFMEEARARIELVSDDHMKIETTNGVSVLRITEAEEKDTGIYTLAIINELGCNQLSSSVTVEDKPDPPVSQPFISNIRNHSLTLSWYGSSYDGGSPILHYRVEMKGEHSPDWSILSDVCEHTSFNVENLEANQGYEFRVCAGNRHGYGDPSKASDIIYTMEQPPADLDEQVSGKEKSMFSFSRPCSFDFSDSTELHVPTPLLLTSPLSPEAFRAARDELPFEPRVVQVNTDRKFEDSYFLGEHIGRGKFGCVYKCTDKTTSRQYAAKFIKTTRVSQKTDVKQEISVMNCLHHPKLLLLWDAFESRREVILVMEHISGGELLNRVIDEDYILTERECVHFMRQICDGVKFIHEQNIVHLDLKPENVMCITKNSNEIKIIDFGLARILDLSKDNKVMFGTAEFVAPEVVNYDAIGTGTDMWSVGVICYILLSGLSPFAGDNDGETFSNVTMASYDFDTEEFDEISNDAKDFIEKLLVKDLKKRMTTAACLKHKWMSQDVKYMRAKRISTEKHKRFLNRMKWRKAKFAVEVINRMQKIAGNLGRMSSRSNIFSSSKTESADSSSRTGSMLSETGSVISDSPANDSLDNIELTNEDVGRKMVNGMSGNSPPKLRPSSDDNSDHNNSSDLIDINQNKQLGISTDSSQTQSKGVSPSFVSNIKDYEVFEGESAKFEAQLETCPGVKVTWYKDGLILFDDSEKYVFNSDEDLGFYALVIKNCDCTDVSEYECRAFNVHGEVSCKAGLHVEGDEE